MTETSEITNAGYAPAPRPPINPWVVAMTVTLATFMEVLDSSIANVSLPHIAGTLGASSQESTWVITSYLVSSAVVLPMSGWLSNLIGRKRFYMGCVSIFTISSFLCALAPSLPMLIFFRILQGAGGGGLQPTEQAILADTFSAKQRSMGFAMYGVAILVAPAIGPTFGGWITDNYSWHWIFLINVPIGILSLILTHRIVHDPAYLRNMTKSNFRVDYVGIGLIVIGVGFLQYVLDKGEENDWFSSHAILISLIIAIVALVALVIRELTHENPIMDLRLLSRRNFATAVTFSFILGMVLNGTTILLPQFLQNDLGYTAQQAGMALSPGALALVFMMPIAGILATKFDPRHHCVRLCSNVLRDLSRYQHSLRRQLPNYGGLPHHPGHRYSTHIHSHQYAELRRSPAEQIQPGLRNQQLSAQPGRRYWCFASQQLHLPPGPNASRCTYRSHQSR
jgi:DHA2 family multidrug resistance protein